MKKILVAIMAGLVISAAMPTMAQRHRHTPMATVKVDSKADKDGNTKSSTTIVAFSDTADVDTADMADEDSLFDAGTYGWDKPYNLEALSDIMENAFLPIAIVFIMFCLAPVLIIALIIYFIIKSRKQKIQLAELALKNGQPIPQDIAKSKQPNDQGLWEKGVKKMFLGIGFVVFSIFIHSRTCTGTGFIIAFYGAGQAIIAWTTKKGIGQATAPSNSPKGEDACNLSEGADRKEENCKEEENSELKNS